MNCYNRNESQVLSLLAIIFGALLLFYVASYFAPYIFCAIVGWKLLSYGLRMRGFPPLFFLISRWF